MRQTSIFTHLAATAIITILSALIYASVQQTYRSGANDPQLQIARDVSNKVKKGEVVDKWFDVDTMEISQSLSVFQALYNEKGQPVLSTGVLNGKLPSLPIGVFGYALKYGEYVFTWHHQKVH